MNAFVAAVMDRLGETFNPESLGAGLAVWTENLLFALITFLAYYAIWRMIRLVFVPLLKRMDVDATGRTFFQTVARVVILTLGAVAALAEVGVNTTSLIASLGVAGLTVGFAARDALSNIISGIFIFWDRPFVLGDLIEIDGKYGRVDRITLRSTRVVTVEGKMLAIPNAEVVNSTVASYTNFPHLRIDIPITVGVAENLSRIRSILLDLVADDAAYMADPPPRMVVEALHDYNVQVSLRAWIHEERDHLLKRFELREAAFEALRAAKVEMPYETIRNLTTVVPAAPAA